MLIIGANGFAKQLFDVIYSNNQNEDVLFFDDVTTNSPEYLYARYKIIKRIDFVSDLFKSDNRFVLGIGNPKIRELLASRFSELGGELTSIISNKSLIGNFNVEIDLGTTILHSVIIESNVKIGKGTLINHGAIVTHDVEMGDFCEICPGSKIAGNVKIGRSTFVGTNCTILPKVKIGNNVIVGAGSVVTKDVQDNVTVVGVPAKIINNSDKYS